MSDTLNPNQLLNAGQRITSNNGLYFLQLQGDGNLVLYRDPDKPLWNTQTVGRGSDTAIMQDDGNFVLYARGAPLWSSGTMGRANARLVVQNDGNMVIYADAGAIWSSNTANQSRPVLSTISVMAIPSLRIVSQPGNGPQTERRQAVYNPPSGYAVLDTSVHIHSSNNGGREISVTGAGANLVTEEQLEELYEHAASAAAKDGKNDVAANFNERKNRHLSSLRKYSTSHNTIIATVYATSNGTWGLGSRAWEEISVHARLIKLGSDVHEIAADLEEEFAYNIPNY